MTSVVEYVPTDTQAVRKKHAFWTALDRVIREVPEHEQWFGSKECKVLGFYGRDTFNDNGERVLSFSADHGLAPLNTLFFNTTKNAISHTFNGWDKGNISRVCGVSHGGQGQRAAGGSKCTWRPQRGGAAAGEQRVDGRARGDA